MSQGSSASNILEYLIIRNYGLNGDYNRKKRNGTFRLRMSNKEFLKVTSYDM